MLVDDAEDEDVDAIRLVEPDVEGIGDNDNLGGESEVVANRCWWVVGEEVSKLVDSIRLFTKLFVAALGVDDSDDLGNLGGLDPPSQDPSSLECCEILKR